MKIAVSAASDDMTGPLDTRFGRAKHFIVVDTDTGESSTHDNSQNLNAAQGAGIQAAETVARLGAQAIITGNVGPKAFRALSAAGIKVFLCGQVTVTEAIERFKIGALAETRAANAEGHWS